MRFSLQAIGTDTHDVTLTTILNRIREFMASSKAYLSLYDPAEDLMRNAQSLRRSRPDDDDSPARRVSGGTDMGKPAYISTSIGSTNGTDVRTRRMRPRSRRPAAFR